MVKNHLKSIAAPASWPVRRKERKYVLRPNPSGHSMKEMVSLNFALIDMLKIAGTKKEVVYILKNKEVLVNGKKRTDKSYGIGLFDVLEVKDIKKQFRMLINERGKLVFVEIDAKEASIKPCKIKDKTLVKKKTQLNFTDGRNILVEKDVYKAGDTILINPSNNKITDSFKLEKGSTIFLTGGAQKGHTGKVEDVIGKKIVYKGKEGVHETLKKYAYVIGKDKSSIKLE